MTAPDQLSGSNTGHVKLSVVIPCYNAAGHLAAQLDALAQQHWTEPWEVVVADNGSTDCLDATLARFAGRLPGLRRVDASARRGAAHARNAGARAARGELLAFCDADDVVAPGWLAAMGAALERHEFAASRFDTDRLNPAWLQQSHLNPQRDGLNQYRYPPFLPHAGGSGLGIRRAVHERVGGFDEALLILEDTDYCWRVQLAGIPLQFVPEATVCIRYPGTLRGLYRQARIYAEYNVLLYKKYRPLGMPALPWTDGLAAWGKWIRRLPRIRHKADLARSLWAFGWRMGRVVGSLKYRVLAL